LVIKDEDVSKSLLGYLDDLKLISYVSSISLDYKYKEVLRQALKIYFIEALLPISIKLSTVNFITKH
ncbi:hypothetical protein Q2295_14710, partial [Leptospira interrogans]